MDVNENRLLVMDDDTDVGAFFGQVGEDLGFEVRVITDPETFAKNVLEFSPSVILLDLQMPGRDGIELLRELSSLDRRPKVLIASGLDSRVLTTAQELGLSMGVDVAGAFCKPIALDELEVLLVRLKSQTKVITVNHLRQGIERGELVVHYLPKATLKGPGRWVVEGAEALVRWEHPEYGLLYPKDFIGLAEESGLIIEVTDFVFRAAMEQARVWFAKGLYMELGVNLSAQFLGDLGFPDRLLMLIRENNLDPSMLTLELTETAAMNDPAVALDILARLRVKNINVCLDDFGTGASSLTHLYKMPFSEVKLDNQFTNDMRLREDARALVEGLIYLAHKLKMRACAEGVEDEATLEMLEAMHCDKVQGHLIGAAVRAKDLEAIVERWNSRAPGRRQSAASS
ncbi:MAG TPA: EAL domain-containing response regulator [Gammaproteobacteria bacterium]|jgi:EAL domain-containing protein (putative c-di-GMP-specific phosphodiesterase class I)/ActR/RegA family two-component response regulator|nr:EAL domain-containing response regulator [Gammaproteobacteria bacterium]